MAGIDLGLSGGMRNTLLTLQSLQAKIGTSQERLASGQRVNAMVDAPAIFFAAKNLNNRANDMMSLKDAMGQAISTVKAGAKGIDSIQSLVDQARGLTTAAMAAMGTDSASVATRQNLAGRFDDIMDAINGVTDDSGYRGKNLLKGNGHRIDATPESKLAVNNLPGIGNARVTNMKGEDTYRVAVLGTGAVTGNPTQVANAEQGRGLAPIIVSGGQSGTQGNFNPITVEIKGPAGRDKQITVGNPPEAATYTFTQDQWKAAKAAGQPLKLDHTFGSGTRISFPVNFDQIEATQPNAGQGVSTIEKHVDLQVKVTNDQDLSVVRDVNSSDGNARLINGENSFVFPSGTVRLNVDEKELRGDTNNTYRDEYSVWMNSIGFNLNYSTSSQWLEDSKLKISYDIVGAPTQVDLLIDGTVVGTSGNAVSGTGSFDGSVTKPDPPWKITTFEIRYTPESLDTHNIIIQKSINPAVDTSPLSHNLITKTTIPPGDKNDIAILFSVNNENKMNIASQNMQISGQGLQVDYSQNEWRDIYDIENAIDGLNTAEQRLRGASHALTNGLNIITTREMFTKEFSDVLSEGAAKLTLLDQNEEGSNLLMLQTRQQLSMTALTLAAKSQQSILNLF